MLQSMEWENGFTYVTVVRRSVRSCIIVLSPVYVSSESAVSTTLHLPPVVIPVTSAENVYNILLSVVQSFGLWTGLVI
jgi:hypothetical protein